jgi:hypothetical protein
VHEDMERCFRRTERLGLVHVSHIRLDEPRIEQRAFRFLPIAEPEERWPRGNSKSVLPCASIAFNTMAKPTALSGVARTVKAILPPGCSTRNAAASASSGCGKCKHSEADAHSAKAVVGKGQVLRIADAKLEVRKDASCLCDHRGREIHAGDVRAATRG